MKIFKLPDLGEGLPDAEITEWHVKVGDKVKLDQPMASMETAKAVVEVPSPRTGTIAKLYGAVGDIIITGSPLIEFTDGEDKASAKPVSEDQGTVVGAIEVQDRVITESATGITPKATSQSGVKVIPAIRHLARKLGVDLNQVTATGPQGLITAEDVKRATTAKSAKTPLDGEALRGVRRSMATTMALSHKQVVPVTILDEVDIAHWPKGTDVTTKLIRAIEAACTAEPNLNAHFDGENLVRKNLESVNLGLAVDTPAGLFVPVIKDTGAQDDKGIRQNIERFKEQAKTRDFPPADLVGASITLSNFGVFAGRFANPIIVPPQVAILAVGRMHDVVVMKGKQCVSHRHLPLALSFDHRAATGGEATRFLATLIKALS